ncbi:uncharacterized protein LOC129226592 [Uloborus diversus]|uniref:uncharacterized protein LOC129226592 n=1 Tax=Uloborus diversus TaxID=327109 RepID=UPI002409EA03|nr:uncharacterized protein LOC129226592 [Uloborus diversus]
MATMVCYRLLPAIQLSLVVLCARTVNADSFDKAEDFTFEGEAPWGGPELDLVDACDSVQGFEQPRSAVNVDLQTVQVHPEAFLFATRCRTSGRPCRGIGEGVQSFCRPKKSWVQVYGRTPGDAWRPHWVAVDTACVCSIRRKRSSATPSSAGRLPLTGKTFLP